MSALDVSAFDEEQHSLFTAYTKDGQFLTQEECEKMFLLNGISDSTVSAISKVVQDKLSANSKQHIQSKLQEIDSRNLSFFKEEEERILRKYIDIALRENFADIFEAIDRFVYFENRKKEDSNEE